MMELARSLILLLLTTTSVCMGAEWNVTYGPAQHICALEGSSIIMQCRYTSPRHLKVKDVQWVNQDMENPVDFIMNANYSYRVVTFCEHKTCSLLLANVSLTDGQQRYQCNITTNDETESYIGEPGISLSVTGLDVVPSKEGLIREGDFVTLTCATTCNLPGNPSFIWLKDGRPLEGKNAQQMVIGPYMKYVDNGLYTCGVRGYKDIPSTAVKISDAYETDDGKPLSSAATVGGVILTIVVIGLIIGIRFMYCYYCIPRRTPQPATIRVTVLSAFIPSRPPNFHAWGNPDGTEPLVS